MAFYLCRGLYLGLRFTNKERFDYISKIGRQNDITLICTERISHSLFDEEFYKHLPKLKRDEKVLVCSGLPPLPIRENFAEMMLYRHPQTIPDEVYDDFCKHFEGTDFIAIGGDIHLGSYGKIINRKTNKRIGRFHTTGPSSGFGSFHIFKDNLGSTDIYRFKVKEFNNRDPNAVFVDLANFTSKSIYCESSYLSSIANLANTAYVFWSV